jgi:hypothetical protein
MMIEHAPFGRGWMLHFAHFANDRLADPGRPAATNPRYLPKSDLAANMGDCPNRQYTCHDRRQASACSRMPGATTTSGKLLIGQPFLACLFPPLLPPMTMPP